MRFLSCLKSNKAPAMECPKPIGVNLLAEAVNEADEATLDAGVKVEAITSVLVEVTSQFI